MGLKYFEQFLPHSDVPPLCRYSISVYMMSFNVSCCEICKMLLQQRPWLLKGWESWPVIHTHGGVPGLGRVYYTAPDIQWPKRTERKRWVLNSIVGCLFAVCSDFLWLTALCLTGNHHDAVCVAQAFGSLRSSEFDTSRWEQVSPKCSSLLILGLLWFTGLYSSSAFEFQTWPLSKTLGCEILIAPLSLTWLFSAR